MTRLAETEPGKYERAAARWHVRFFPEVPNVDILENQAVLALLAAIPANRLLSPGVIWLLVGVGLGVALVLISCWSSTRRDSGGAKGPHENLAGGQDRRD